VKSFTTALTEAGRIKPLLSEQRFSPEDLERAYACVEAGSFGKVAVEIQPDYGESLHQHFTEYATLPNFKESRHFRFAITRVVGKYLPILENCFRVVPGGRALWKVGRKGDVAAPFSSNGRIADRPGSVNGRRHCGGTVASDWTCTRRFCSTGRHRSALAVNVSAVHNEIDLLQSINVVERIDGSRNEVSSHPTPNLAAF
jgi:hypothetical protein